MTPSRIARPTSTAIDRTHTSAGNCWPCTRKNSRPCRTCCGRNRMSRLRNLAALLIALAAFSAFANNADDRFELKYGKNLPFHGGRVTIDHAFGELVVRTHNGSDVQV